MTPPSPSPIRCGAARRTPVEHGSGRGVARSLPRAAQRRRVTDLRANLAATSHGLPHAVVNRLDVRSAPEWCGAAAPQPQHRVTADHAAEVREMRDALLRARDAEIELERGVQ